jgi:hypothetical protein
VGPFPHVPAHRRVATVRRGSNVVQVQRWLGHHSPSFTLDTYVHLLDADLGEPLAGQVNTESTEGPQTAATPHVDELIESALQAANVS